MVSIANTKLAPFGRKAAVAAAEDLEDFATNYIAAGEALFDGAFSNFAALNCVIDLKPAARALARLLKPGASAMLVLFRTFCPGEMLTETLRGQPSHVLRRFKSTELRARLAQREFQIRYHRRNALMRAFSPWFVLEKRMGIGITVPPSAAEPWISRRPRLLAVMETLDHMLSRPMAILGDHVLYHFRQTGGVMTISACAALCIAPTLNAVNQLPIETHFDNRKTTSRHSCDTLTRSREVRFSCRVMKGEYSSIDNVETDCRCQLSNRLGALSTISFRSSS